MPKRAPNTEYKEENLVVLSYSGNTSYTRVTELKKFLKAQDGLNDVEVDLANGRWTYKDECNNSPDRCRGIKGFDFGSSRRCRWGSQWGVIGIFDRTNIDHLQAMISASKAATAEPSYSQD